MKRKLELLNETSRLLKELKDSTIDFGKRAVRCLILVQEVNNLIDGLRVRGYTNRDRLLRKMIEEMGEYAEAVEYHNGATRKVKKFKGKDSKKMLREEISDLIMVGFALAKVDGYKIEDVLMSIRDKLSKREAEHQKGLGKSTPAKDAVSKEYIDRSIK